MVHVAKYHGAGNDFVVVDAAAADVPDRRAFARVVCDRERGVAHATSPTVGADGVLLLDLEAGRSPPRVGMTLVQPDGSVPAACGNGARCAAAWAVARTGGEAVTVATPAGPRRATVGTDGTASVRMGAPTFAPDAVPVAGTEPLVERQVAGLTVTAVRAGVPHAVAFVDDVEEVDLERVAPPVRHAGVFPEGANVTVASGRPGGGFDQRTYERGVEAETDACGTGAVAVVAAAAALGRCEPAGPVSVAPPGGELGVTLADDAAVLTGPVAKEFETDVPDRPA